MTRERPTGSASAGLQQIGKITTVLGTRCFLRSHRQPRPFALLRARSLPRHLIVNHVRGRKSNRLWRLVRFIPSWRYARGILVGRGLLLGQGLVLEPCLWL